VHGLTPAGNRMRRRLAATEQEEPMLMSTSARVTMRNTEKKVLHYYDDGGKGKGNCTWGIGTLAHRGPCTAEELARVVTDADVEREFNVRLRDTERGVERNIKVPLTQDQFDALVSLAYNTGVAGAGQVFKLVNARDFDGAAEMISSMTYGSSVKNGKTVRVFYPGLVVRRKREAAPFRKSVNASFRRSAK
jgi:lysozyme